MTKPTESFVTNPSQKTTITSWHTAAFFSRDLKLPTIPCPHTFFTSLTAQKPSQALELVKQCHPKISLTRRSVPLRSNNTRRQGRNPLAPDTDLDLCCKNQHTVLQKEGTARERPKVLPELRQSKPRRASGKKCIRRIIHCFCNKAA